MRRQKVYRFFSKHRHHRSTINKNELCIITTAEVKPQWLNKLQSQVSCTILNIKNINEAKYITRENTNNKWNWKSEPQIPMLCQIHVHF